MKKKRKIEKTDTNAALDDLQSEAIIAPIVTQHN